MLLNASVGATIRTKNEDKVKELIEKMCQNEYRPQRDRGLKVEDKKKGIWELDSHTNILAQLEVLAKKLAGSTIIPRNTNVSQAQVLQCDFYGQAMLMETANQMDSQKKHGMKPIFKEAILILKLTIQVGRTTLISSGAIQQV